MKPTAPLSLDAAALADDRLWWGLGAEARGVLASLWVAFATRGPLPDDPVAAARMALLDERPVLAHWDDVAPFFRREAGQLESPHLEAAMESRARRSRAASLAGKASQRKRSFNAGSTNAQRTLQVDAVPSVSIASSPGVSPLVLSPIPPISLMGEGSSSLESKEITTPGARVAPSVPESTVSGMPLIVPPDADSVPAVVPRRTPRPKSAPTSPPSYRDLFANPEHLEWFDKAVTLRSEHVERMPARLREVGGVAGVKLNPWAVQFLARVKSGYAPRLLVACLYLYLEHGEDVQRGYVQGLDVFWGNPASPKTKATFQAFLAGASATLAKSDARRAAEGAPVAAAPTLPAVSPALLAEAGMPIPPS